MSRSVEVITTLLNDYNTSLFSSFHTTSIIMMCIDVIENIQFIYIFKKHVECTKLDLHACITGWMPLLMDYLSLWVSAAQYSVLRHRHGVLDIFLIM